MWLWIIGRGSSLLGPLIGSLEPLSHDKYTQRNELKARDLCHDQSEVISGHMAQVQICDCIEQRRSPLEEDCSFICVHTTTFHSQASKCCGD